MKNEWNVGVGNLAKVNEQMLVVRELKTRSRSSWKSLGVLGS